MTRANGRHGVLVSFDDDKGRLVHTAAVMTKLPAAKGTFEPLATMGLDWSAQLKRVLGKGGDTHTSDLHLYPQPRFIRGVGNEGSGNFATFSVLQSSDDTFLLCDDVSIRDGKMCFDHPRGFKSGKECSLGKLEDGFDTNISPIAAHSIRSAIKCWRELFRLDDEYHPHLRQPRSRSLRGGERIGEFLWIKNWKIGSLKSISRKWHSNLRIFDADAQ